MNTTERERMTKIDAVLVLLALAAIAFFLTAGWMAMHAPVTP